MHSTVKEGFFINPKKDGEIPLSPIESFIYSQSSFIVGIYLSITASGIEIFLETPT